MQARPADSGHQQGRLHSCLPRLLTPLEPVEQHLSDPVCQRCWANWSGQGPESEVASVVASLPACPPGCQPVELPGSRLDPSRLFRAQAHQRLFGAVSQLGGQAGGGAVGADQHAAPHHLAVGALDRPQAGLLVKGDVGAHLRGRVGARPGQRASEDAARGICPRSADGSR